VLLLLHHRARGGENDEGRSHRACQHADACLAGWRSTLRRCRSRAVLSVTYAIKGLATLLPFSVMSFGWEELSGGEDGWESEHRHHQRHGSQQLLQLTKTREILRSNEFPSVVLFYFQCDRWPWSCHPEACCEGNRIAVGLEDLRLPPGEQDAEDSEEMGRIKPHDCFIERPYSIGAWSPAWRTA
jgi:hypothetical protein